MTGKIGVVGAGLMGAEIALVYALAGYDVLLSDQSEAALAGALERLDRIMDRGIGRVLDELAAVGIAIREHAVPPW